LDISPLYQYFALKSNDARDGANDMEEMMAIPNDDIDAVDSAFDALSQTNERFFQAFKAMSDEDRLSRKGVQLAYLRSILEVTRGNKIVTLADPIAEMATLDDWRSLGGPSSSRRLALVGMTIRSRRRT
jgi:hypothetical protein